MVLVDLELLTRLWKLSFVVGSILALESIFIAHRARHLRECGVLRAPRLTAEHVFDRADGKACEHSEITLLDVLLLIDRSENVDLRVFCNEVIGPRQPASVPSHVLPPRRQTLTLLRRQRRCPSLALVSLALAASHRPSRAACIPPHRLS